MRRAANSYGYLYTRRCYRRGACGVIGNLYSARLETQKPERAGNQRLRNSLLAELATMDDLLPTDSDGRKDMFPVGISMPSNVFQSNSNRLSILNQEETDRVIRFYSGALKFQKMVEGTVNLLSGDNESLETLIEERGGAKKKIQQEWIRCVVSLLENSAVYPEAIVLEGRRIEPGESIGFEELWIFLNYEGISDKGLEAEPIW